MENFPSHQIFCADVEDELKGILGHGAISEEIPVISGLVLSFIFDDPLDDSTSPGSTFPWSAKECTEYISIIERFKSKG